MNDLYDIENNNIEEIKKEEDPLAILSLEIENGLIKQIKLFKNSNPEEVAFGFCKENNIDFSLMGQIKNEIEYLMNSYFQSTKKEKDIDNNKYCNSQKNKNNKNSFYNKNILNSEEYNSYQIINQSKNIMDNTNESNKRKLFFYQFLQNQKLGNSYFNKKSNSVNKFKMKIFNTISNTNHRNKKKSIIPRGKNLKYINENYLTGNFNITNNDNSNIFNRLYNDAKIKRIVYKRPCHYGIHSKESNGFQDYLNNIYETINGRTINKKDLDINQNYIRSYQIKPNKLLNENYSFHPNSTKNYQANIIKHNNSYKLNSTYNSYNLQGDSVSYHKKNNNLKSISNSNHNSYLNNNLNFNHNNILYEENYIPLKDKIMNYSNQRRNNNLTISDNIQNQSVEAFTNIFNLLTDNGKNQILNKNNININNIDNNLVLILSPLIEDINNKEIELNYDEFIKRLLNNLTIEDKKFLILNYSNQFINNDETKEKLIKKKVIKNKKFGQNINKKNTPKRITIPNYFNSEKKFRLSSGTEKKKNFYYL